MTNDKANTAMYCGIGALVCMVAGCVIPLVGTIGIALSIAAIFIGFQGLSQANLLDGAGRPQAMAGIAMGFGTLAMWALILLGVFVAVILMVLSN
jgi:hypothetical protein